MKLLLLTAALVGVTCASLLRDFSNNRAVGPATVEGAISGTRATGHTVNQFVLNVRELTAFDRNLDGADDEDISLDQGHFSLDLDTYNETAKAIFERDGGNNVGPATVGGAISGDGASGHNLNQFIVNVEKLRSNRDLTNDYITRLAKRIVDQANRNRPFALDIEEQSAKSSGHILRQFTRDIDRLIV